MIRVFSPSPFLSPESPFWERCAKLVPHLVVQQVSLLFANGTKAGWAGMLSRDVYCQTVPLLFANSFCDAGKETSLFGVGVEHQEQSPFLCAFIRYMQAHDCDHHRRLRGGTLTKDVHKSRQSRLKKPTSQIPLPISGPIVPTLGSFGRRGGTIAPSRAHDDAILCGALANVRVRCTGTGC